MRSTSILFCIMTMISNFTIFFTFQIFTFKFFFTNITGLCIFHMTSAALLLTTSFSFFLKLIIFIVCSLINSCLFSMLLKEDIVDIEKPDGICLLTFVVDEFSGLFLHPSIFSIIHSRSA